MNTQAKLVLDQLVVECRPFVTDIEALPETTQNHYGDYLALITSAAKSNKTQAMLFGLALMMAGANKAGVRAALKVAGVI